MQVDSKKSTNVFILLHLNAPTYDKFQINMGQKM